MLIRDVAAGRLADGAKLPPERQMATDLGIAVGTLRKALADLQDKGLLERVQGSGNYIRARADVPSIYGFFRLEKRDGGGLPLARVLSVSLQSKPAMAPVFGPHAEAHRIRRLRWLDDLLIAVEEIWLDASHSEKITPADLSDSLYLYYRTALGLQITAAEDRVGLADLPEWTPDQFHLPCGTKTGYIERISRDSTGAPAEFSRTWYDPERAQYVSRIGKG